MQLAIPDFALVVLIGSSGSGKSTLAAQHFLPTEVLNSDRCRGWVADDDTDQSATPDAFAVLHYIAATRLARRRLTVVDATSVRPEDRKHYIDMAHQYHAIPVAIVLDMPEQLCQARNQARPDRQFGLHVVRQQQTLLRRSLAHLKREGFRHIYVLRSQAEVDGASIARQPLFNDRRSDHGPFDIIGDVHGCFVELNALLQQLGYADVGGVPTHPEGRRVIFVGDLVDRGPNSLAAARLAVKMVASGTALCVPGNHDVRLLRKLRGERVALTYGLAETLQELDALPEDERKSVTSELRQFIDGLVSHYWLDDGKLVVAHAGMKEEMQGRGSGAVRAFALYGETTGETDEYGLPVRFNWAAEYKGRPTVVYGHVPTPQAEWLNRTICIDTGCVFGGRLTALRYPELELLSVPAERVYCEPVRPLAPSSCGRSLQQEHDALPDIADVIGMRIIKTAHAGNVRVDAGHAAAALEVMSRFCVDLRWLIYLPPTMSPAEASARPDMLESPETALEYYHRAGVESVIAEEKHMGSRAVIVAATSAEAAAQRFGVEDGRAGVVFTRTGRPFFKDVELEKEVIARTTAAIDAAGLWKQLNTNWLCIDAEVMPWSAKAQALISAQYQPVGIAAEAETRAAGEAAARAAARGIDASALQQRLAARGENARAFSAAWQRYQWPVSGIQGLRIAPFHLMASEGAVHHNQSHTWHLETLAGIAAADPLLFCATDNRAADLADASQRQQVVTWWEALTAAGGEGIVIKPLEFVAEGRSRAVQPAVKCRGAEYLRIIYGPDYLLHLPRLRQRALGRKRSLALREFALGLEALQRFIAHEPLNRVHECVFGVLAMETAPVDPRL